MKVGFSLLAENEDGGVEEIPSSRQDTLDIEVEIPVIAEEAPVSVQTIQQPETDQVSLEDLVDLKNTVMKAQGVNKDFVLSMEALVPSFLKDNGFYIGSYTECLSKVNYDNTVKALDIQIGKVALQGLTVSQEAVDYDLTIVGESIPDSLKAKWNESKDRYEDVSDEELMAFGQTIVYKLYHSFKNEHAINEMYNTVLSGAGEIRYINGTPILSANPAFQAPSTVSDVQPEVVVSEEGLKDIVDKVKYIFVKKGLSNSEAKEIFKDFKPFIENNVVRVLIIFDEHNNITLMLREKDSDTMTNFTYLGKAYENKKDEFKETVKSVNAYVRPWLEKLKLKSVNIDYIVEHGSVKKINQITRKQDK